MIKIYKKAGINSNTGLWGNANYDYPMLAACIQGEEIQSDDQCMNGGVPETKNTCRCPVKFYGDSCQHSYSIFFMIFF